MQLQTFLDDPVYRDQHTVQMEIIRTFARVGPNAEPRFRDECKFTSIYLIFFFQMKILNNFKWNENSMKIVYLEGFFAKLLTRIFANSFIYFNFTKLNIISDFTAFMKFKKRIQI